MTLSLSPAVFRIENFIKPEEIKDLIHRVETSNVTHKLERSVVGDSPSEHMKSAIRTSHQAWDDTSDVADALKRRAFNVMRLPHFNERQVDGMQILRYQQKEAYIGHHDYCLNNDDPKYVPARGGSNRIATLFVYMTDVAEGGQTVWTRTENRSQYNNDLKAKVQKLFPQGGWEAEMLETCHTKLSVAPKRGDAVLFYDVTPDGMLDEMSEHGGCPVISGTKWAANLWVWNDARLTETSPVAVQFVNRFDQTVYLSWRVRTEGSASSEGWTAWGATEADQTIDVDTYAEHEWGAHFVSPAHEPGKAPFQQWDFSGPQWRQKTGKHLVHIHDGAKKELQAINNEHKLSSGKFALRFLNQAAGTIRLAWHADASTADKAGMLWEVIESGAHSDADSFSEHVWEARSEPGGKLLHSMSVKSMSKRMKKKLSHEDARVCP